MRHPKLKKYALNYVSRNVLINPFITYKIQLKYVFNSFVQKMSSKYVFENRPKSRSSLRHPQRTKEMVAYFLTLSIVTDPQHDK